MFIDKPADEIKADMRNYIHDMTINFMSYNRKTDEDYNKGCIEDAIRQGAFTIDDLVAEFRKQLEKYV